MSWDRCEHCFLQQQRQPSAVSATFFDLAETFGAFQAAQQSLVLSWKMGMALLHALECCSQEQQHYLLSESSPAVSGRSPVLQMTLAKLETDLERCRLQQRAEVSRDGWERSTQRQRGCEKQRRLGCADQSVVTVALLFALATVCRHQLLTTLECLLSCCLLLPSQKESGSPTRGQELHGPRGQRRCGR